MTSKSLLSLVLAFALLPGLVLAEDAKARAAREELERQLQGMMESVPTKVRIDYAEVSDPNYELQEAVFELDGKRLLTPPPGALSMADEKLLVWQGDVSPGKHVVTARLKYKNNVSVVMSNEGGQEWKLSGDRSFEQQSGIEVRVLVKTVIDPKASSVEKRLVLSLPAQPVMIAKLDDGSMPAAAPKVVVDAGPTAEELAAAKKAEAAKAADDERQRKADEALAAKQAAADERQRLAEDAKAAKLPAAEPVNVAKNPRPVVIAPVEVVDAGALVVALPVDAGSPAAPDAGPQFVAAQPISDEEDSFPWLLVAMGGGVVTILLVVIARRRSRPPTLDD